MTTPRLVFLAVAAAGVYFQGDLLRSHNALARYDQTVSIVAYGTLSIDRHVRNTDDWSLSGGRYYPNKPPGLSLLGVPPYFLLYHGERLAGLDPLDERSAPWRVNHAILAVLLNGLLVALAAAASVAVLRRVGAGETASAIGAMAWALATLVLPYCVALWSHAHTAALVMLALRFALVPGSAPDRWRWPAAGGVAGLAVLSDYSVVLALPALAAMAWGERRAWRDVAAFAAGGLPAAAALLVYHAACFGHPLVTAYAGNNPVFIAPGRTGLAGQFELPPPGRPLELLVGPYKGLFFHSPVLLLGIAGAVLAWRAGRRAIAVAALAVPAAFVALNSSWWCWEGGYSVGPRFLIPSVPFLMLPAALAFDRWPRASAVLGAASFAGALATAAVQVGSPDRNPLFRIVLPYLLSGDLQHTNLGMLLGLPGRASLLPLVVAWAALGWALARRLRPSPPPGHPV